MALKSGSGSGGSDERSAGWLKYLYVDESGDLGKYGSKCFTIAGVLVDNPKILSRIPKKIRQRKLKKKLRELPELKANRSPPELRKLVLKKVNTVPCEIFGVVVDKSKIYDYLFKAKTRLYNYFCGQLIKQIPAKAGKLVIVIDKKHGNTLLLEDFNHYIERMVSRQGAKVEIYHVPSSTSNELQVADFVVWSINRKFSTGDEEYFKLIEDKITNRERMMLWK